MESGLLFGIILKVIGGLGIFLLGMKHLSEGMQAVAGHRLRRMIGKATDNRLMAVFVGLLVTCLIQSSSITTVMVVGFVNGGFMTLMQAIGVIFGANIGTTITGWIISLLPKVGKFGLPILGISALFFLFARKDRIRFTAMAVMGLGMIFFGLELMSGGLSPIRTNEEYQTFFSLFQATSYLGVLKCAFVGCIVTVIVQSSSATLGITMALLFQGSLSFETAAALVLGENIGTTITAYLASIGANANAKRAAYAHIVFNVLGVLWATALFLPLLLPLSYAFMGPEPTVDAQLRGVAMVHTCFNVTNTLIFLPLMGLVARIVTRMVPSKAEKETTHLTYIDMRMLDSPALGVEQSRREVLVMADGVRKMFDYLLGNLEGKEWDRHLEEKTFRREEILDNIQREITVFLGRILQGRVPKEVTGEVRMQIRLADEFESVSDEVVAILKLFLKAQKNNLDFSEEGRRELIDLHKQVREYLEMLYEALEKDGRDILVRAHPKTTQVKRLMKEYRKRHLDRLAEKGVPPLQSLIFTDVLNVYRQINEHLLNIAEVIAGEK